jgi:site-specific recombinase XerD
MGTIKKINEEYYIEFYARGLLYQKKAGANFNEAERLLKETEEKITNGELATISREVQWDIFFATYRDDVSREFPKRTQQRYLNAINHFTAFLAVQNPSLKYLSQLTPRLFEDYRIFLSGQNISAKVINLSILILRDVMDLAIKLGYLNDNPTIHVKLLKVQSISPRILTNDQLGCVIAHASPKLKQVIKFVLATGCRLTEAFELTFRSIDFEKKYITISPSAEGQNSREIPMSEELLLLLKDLFKNPNQHIFADVIIEDAVHELARIKISCGLNDSLSFLVLRNNFAKFLMSKGVSLYRLQKILGVEDFARMMKYVGFIERDLEQV